MLKGKGDGKKLHCVIFHLRFLFFHLINVLKGCFFLNTNLVGMVTLLYYSCIRTGAALTNDGEY